MTPLNFRKLYSNVFLISFALFFWSGSEISSKATGVYWPANQLLPTFSAPAPVLDCIDISSSSGAEIDLFSSLEGIVNRTQPRIVTVTSADGEGKFFWLNAHDLPYSLINGYSAITKYQTNVIGLVVTDTNQPDTLNLATTIAGVKNELICNPSLLSTLTNAPYNLPIVDDLRGMFTSKYQVYGYLYSNYWSQCTHRLMAGFETNLNGCLRDYLVAMKVATVWLDPGPGNTSDQSTLGLFLSGMTPVNGVYIGWWPSEANGLGWIGQYGIPVLASDYLRNASVFGGVQSPVNVPPIPPPPPLQNKVYVSLILSDGDNIQYMQHAMKIRWNNTSRGTIPIGWTVSPLALDADPGMLNYYWSTASHNDCLISGPSGAGYAHAENWSSANISAFAKISNLYLQHSGLRVITIWDQVGSFTAYTFATNCPTLFGLTDQSGGAYTSVNSGLCTMGLAVAYSSSTNDILAGITNAAQSWNGTAPMFLAAQAVVWDLTPTDLRNIANTLDPNKYVIVRPDHLFMLYNHITSYPSAITTLARTRYGNTATLQGSAIPNATNCVAWFEWGTNLSYGTKTTFTNLTGTSPVMVNAGVTALQSHLIYHYRLAVSNALGVVYGADKTFTAGGRLKGWGANNFNQISLPPGLTNVASAACGTYHGLAVLNDGTVAAWGYNANNQTNVPAGLSDVVAVAAGMQHSVALKSDGTVVAWGGNLYGQTNVPAGLSNVIAIAAGTYHTLALIGDGTVVAWGYNNLNQATVPSGLTNAVAIAAGLYHSMALKMDGTVVVWGNNSFGQTNVPAGLNNIVAVSAGQYHSVAVHGNGATFGNLHPDSDWAADSLSLADGSSLGSWSDTISGVAATQPNGANQPQVYSNSLNGHRVVRFSGAANQFLMIAASNSVISGAGDFTIAMVFAAATQGDSSSSFFLNSGLLGAEQPNIVNDWALCLNGSQLGAGLGSSANNCSADTSLYGGIATDGKPHIAAYVRSGGTLNLFLDGEMVASQPGLCTAVRGSYDALIGAMTTNSHFFTGDIAELQLYGRALNASELLTLDQVLATKYSMSGIAGAPSTRWIADNLTGIDGSAVSNWVDAIAGKSAHQSATAKQPRIYSNSINGHKVVRFSSAAAQFLTIAAADDSIAGAGSFTISVVFRTSTGGNTSTNFYLNTGLLATEQSGVVGDWALCINGSQLGAGLGGGATGCGADLSLYGGTVTDGNPHIATYLRSGDTISLYVDGVLVVTQSNLCSLERGAFDMQIGAMTTGLYFFNGDIAEIQLYNRALTPQEFTVQNEILASTYGIKGAAPEVVVWGSNSNGQTNTPVTLTNVSAVTAGSDFNLALDANGALVGWDDNTAGQTGGLPGLTNVSMLAGGTGFALAIGNQTPLASGFTNSGFVNHDLTLMLPGSDPDGNAFGFQLTSFPSSGALYQYSGGARGALITASSNSVADASGRVIFAPADASTGSPYAAFDFVASDFYYSSTPAHAAINLAMPAAPQFNLASVDAASHQFNLGFLGSSNATYSLWASSNLTSWVRIGTASEITPGDYQFVDSLPANSPARFYSARVP